MRLVHSKFCSLYCTGLSIEKTPTSSPGRCFDSLALEKTQEALKGSLGRGVPAKPSSPDTLFKTKIVGSTKWTAHCQPSTHFLDTQCKTFTLKTIQLLCVQRLHFRGISYFSFSHASSCHEKGASARWVAAQGPAHSHLGHIRKCPPQSHQPFGGAGVGARVGGRADKCRAVKRALRSSFNV